MSIAICQLVSTVGVALFGISRSSAHQKSCVPVYTSQSASAISATSLNCASKRALVFTELVAPQETATTPL